MKIGIIGKGFVGGTLYSAFSTLNHEVSFYDPKVEGSKFEDVLDTDSIYVCVPTDSLDFGGCDISIVSDTIEKLNKLKYKGIIAIKSTIPPGTTEYYIKLYPQLKICFVPEFLRERMALKDFIYNQDVLIVGTDDSNVYDKIIEMHGSLPKHRFQLTPNEAELSKYFNNVYNALRVVFANGFYDVCNLMDADYSKILNALSNKYNIDKHYLECNENLRGFGGYCLPKDTAAFNSFVKNLGLDSKIFEVIVEDNKLYKRTVFEGMRK